VPIIVHHLERSRSHRILWFLEEAELPYEVRTYARHPKTWRAPDELRQIHPRGRSPVVEADGDVLAESGAILETLAERHAPQLLPAANTDAARHGRYFLHYAEGSLMPPLLVGLITDRVRTAPVPIFLRPLVRRIADNIHRSYTGPELEGHWAFLDDHLSHHRWFAGDELTIADIQLSYPIVAADRRGALTGHAPHLRAWIARVEAREAFQRALDRGGPIT